ncbi:PAS domain-containing protein [Nannocystis pusilla]|uniref:PAS domain-containing protein n=1 Tax=Nannocystis pusilla TaxID=889268 RepID=UPI003B75E678
MRASEAEQRAMFSAMTDAVLIVDRDGRYLRVPETASDARHKPDPRLLGKTMHDALPAAEADVFVAGIRRVLAERRMLNNVYSRTIAGEELWFSANASPSAPTPSSSWSARSPTKCATSRPCATTCASKSACASTRPRCCGCRRRSSRSATTSS